jgi:hypothetical protein
MSIDNLQRVKAVIEAHGEPELTAWFSAAYRAFMDEGEDAAVAFGVDAASRSAHWRSLRDRYLLAAYSIIPGSHWSKVCSLSEQLWQFNRRRWRAIAHLTAPPGDLDLLETFIFLAFQAAQKNGKLPPFSNRQLHRLVTQYH